MTTKAFLQVPDPITVSGDVVNGMQQSLPDWRAGEDDPGVYWADLVGDRERNNAVAYNAAAAQTYILTATGDALNARLQDVGITPAEYEGKSDDEKRRLYFDKWTALTDATDEWALFIARQRISQLTSQGETNLPTIGDIALQQKPIGTDGIIPMHFWAIDRMGEPIVNKLVGENPGVNHLLIVQRALRDDTAIYLRYDRQEARKIDYTVVGTVTYQRGSPNPQLQAEASLKQRMLDLRLLDTEIPRIALASALFIENVENVEINMNSELRELVLSPITSSIFRSGGLVWRGAVDNSYDPTLPNPQNNDVVYAFGTIGDLAPGWHIYASNRWQLLNPVAVPSKFVARRVFNDITFDTDLVSKTDNGTVIITLDEGKSGVVTGKQQANPLPYGRGVVYHGTIGLDENKPDDPTVSLTFVEASR